LYQQKQVENFATNEIALHSRILTLLLLKGLVSMLRRSLLFFSLIFSGLTAFSQQTLIYSNPNATFDKAVVLYDEHKYSAAAHLFQQVSLLVKEDQATLKVQADYYYAVCSMYLDHVDAEKQMMAFIHKHPQSPEVHHIDFLLGNYEYGKRRYKEALVWYNKTDLDYLEPKELNEYYYKKGYSCFARNQMDSAKKYFAQVTDSTSSFYPGATYYYGYISYKQKNYQTAVNGFNKLRKDPNFGKAVPYYIAECYYLEGNYAKAAEYCIPLIDSVPNASAMLNSDEIKKIAAESYYRLHQYKDAIPYFEKYAKAGSLEETEAYEFAYCYYITGQYDKAIPYFQNAATGNDTLTQDALYHVGECYMNTGQKDYAANAFHDAYKLDYDQGLKENALFNFAKISYETCSDPFDAAVTALSQYLNAYPNSTHRDEAYQYLVNIYSTTKNYEAALSTLAMIKKWDSHLQGVYQRLCYYRGVDLFNNSQFELATGYFEKSLTFNFDSKLHLQAYYWKAEAFYREKKYNDAIAVYNEYLGQAGAFNTPEYNLSQYGCGYSFFQMKDYDNAATWFRKYVATETKDKDRLCDAYNRIGDCYFVKEDYASSIPFYQQCVGIKARDADYASYQLAQAEGVLHQFDAKIKTLTAFLANYPMSSYYSSAMMELANAYLSNNQPKEAALAYQRMIEEYPDNPNTNQCLLQMGQIYYNEGQNDDALKAWQQVAEKDKNSNEGSEALAHIKMLYVSEGQVSNMQDYLSKLGVSLGHSALDSATFSVVKSDYLKEDFTKLLPDDNDYIKKFPDGIFSAEAHFYRAECYYKLKNNDSAIADYCYVLKTPKTYYTLTCLVHASQIDYSKQNYSEALDYFNELGGMYQDDAQMILARTGKMRCNNFLNKYDALIGSADTVIHTAQINNDVHAEAYFLKAKALLQKQQYDSAVANFTRVTKMTKSEMQGESKYDIANIQYAKGDFLSSEKTVFDLVNQEPSYPQWMAKALVVLADDYVAVNDNFQAKHTLNTVIENATDTAVVNIAKHKLSIITEGEQKAMQKPPLRDSVLIMHTDTTGIKPENK
jgi:TolA-binding protein